MECYFCGQPVTRSTRSRHHVLPRRYFRRRKEADANNIQIAHNACHQRWHREYDKPKMGVDEYCEYVQRLNWGKNIFA